MPHKGAVIAILGLLIVTGRDHLAGATAIEVMNRDCAVSQLETTMRRSMALLADGTLWQWGMVPLDTEHWKPIPVVGIERVRAFSMAVDCTHVLLEDGTVWGWGANQYSCVGAGMSPLITELVQLDLPEPVESLEGGTSHVLGVCASGAVVGWGSNLEWQLGFPLQLEVSTPTVIPGLSSIVAVSAGKGHSLALAADGSVFAFGNNSD